MSNKVSFVFLKSENLQLNLNKDQRQNKNKKIQNQQGKIKLMVREQIKTQIENF